MLAAAVLLSARKIAFSNQPSANGKKASRFHFFVVGQRPM
jgi:hypothetical protein